MKYKLFKKFIERILEHMEINHADLFEKSRKKSVVEARQLLYYLCTKRGMRPTEIKDYMSREGHSLEHTTILHGIKEITSTIENDKDFELIANSIMQEEIEV
jgi:chromosomal replication initiation ATPase DnaA|tara:strand:+ start:666 stop:971 length:306 start_codon:yes stop_codon:yes gene_type:complete